MLRVKVEPSSEDFWKLDPVIDLIHRGGVGVIPTDTVYASTTRLVSSSF
jgi:tRNA A37 threonylcarbamoyladenosine synthetase subunit TsaC/SUA5/YrdC